MNCEKCKNKKATVFYADDGGGQHALCATCAELLGKLSHYSSSSDQDSSSTSSSPDSSLFSLSCPSEAIFPVFACRSADGSDRKCPFCSTSLSLIERTGRVGCPDCYSVFEEFLFPETLSAEHAIGSRMPRKKRLAIEHRRNITSLKQRIRLAIESEDYELAATIRDEIKKLEIQTVGGQ